MTGGKIFLDPSILPDGAESQQVLNTEPNAVAEPLVEAEKE